MRNLDISDISIIFVLDKTKKYVINNYHNCIHNSRYHCSCTYYLETDSLCNQSVVYKYSFPVDIRCCLFHLLFLVCLPWSLIVYISIILQTGHLITIDFMR